MIHKQNKHMHSGNIYQLIKQQNNRSKCDYIHVVQEKRSKIAAVVLPLVDFYPQGMNYDIFEVVTGNGRTVNGP